MTDNNDRKRAVEQHFEALDRFLKSKGLSADDFQIVARLLHEIIVNQSELIGYEMAHQDFSMMMHTFFKEHVKKEK
jgi:hypothetical protein